MNAFKIIVVCFVLLSVTSSCSTRQNAEIVSSRQAAERRARAAVAEAKTGLLSSAYRYARATAELDKGVIKDMASSVGGLDLSQYPSAWHRNAAKHFDGSAADARALQVYIGLSELDARDRATAAVLLGACGHNASPSVPQLISFLKSDDIDLRFAAAMALGHIGDSRALKPLLSRLSDDDELFRRAAINSLGWLGVPGAVDGLGKRLGVEPDRKNRESIVVALGRIGGERAFRLLILALNEEHGSVRNRAVKELGKTADIRALEPLLGVIGCAGSIREALVRIGKPAVPRLLHVFQTHPDERVCHFVSKVLGDIKDLRAIDVMVARIVASGAGSYSSAEECLLMIGEPSLVPLIEALKNEDGKVRIRVICAIERFRGPKVADTMLSALGDSNDDVRRIALQELRTIGDKRCIPQAFRMFKEDEDSGVRRAAGEILGTFRPPGSLAVLTAALSDWHPYVRRTAAWGLGEFGAEAEAAIPALEKLLEDKEKWPGVSKSATRSLKKIKDQVQSRAN